MENQSSDNTGEGTSDPLRPTSSSNVVIKRFDKKLRSITSILIRSSLLFVFILIVVLFAREINDDSYQIREFNVPKKYVDAGYNEKYLAWMLNKRINWLKSTAMATWSPEETQNYKESSPVTSLRIEVGGVGLSPETFIRPIREFFGIKEKEIVCNLLELDSGNLRLNISSPDFDFKVERLAGFGDTIEYLVTDGALKILQWNDPLLAGLIYGGDYTHTLDGYEIGNNPSFAIDMFRRVIGSNPKQASTAYAWWANTLFRNGMDTAESGTRLRKALELDPKNAFAYRVKAMMAYRRGNYAGGDNLMKRSLELNPNSEYEWLYLANRYFEREKNWYQKAISAYRRAIELNPNSYYQWDLARALFHTSKYTEALELIDEKSNKGMESTEAGPLRLAILIALGDSIKSKYFFEKYRLEDARNLSSELNDIVFRMERDRDRPQLAFELIHLAIQADPQFSIPYTTLAELHGLNGNTEEFYNNLEKALLLGYPIKELSGFEIQEPYRTYREQEQYRKLLAKFESMSKN